MQKISIKREQSQAGLSFAEREKFRPQVKNKLLLLLVLLLMAATGAWAQTQWTSGDCTVTLSNGTLTVSGKGAMADYDNFADRSWQNNINDITSVVVESGVTTVGKNAFYACTGLTSVTLPEGLTKIGVKAFRNCNNLTSITIPSTVTSIGSDAFFACSGMTDVYLYPDPANLSWDDGDCDDFKANKATQCHVLAEHLSAYQTKLNSVNVTVVGDLKPLPTTYSITLDEGTGKKDSQNWEIKPQSSELSGGEAVTVKYNGSREVKSVTVVKKVVIPDPIALSAVTADNIGSVVTSDGNVYPAKTPVLAGKTAVGILGKVTSTGHGLILALKDAAQQNWNTINGWTSVNNYAGTTLKRLPNAAHGTNLTSYTTLGETAVSNWAVAQKSDYDAIFTNLGSKTGDSDGTTYDANVNAYITTGVGGTALSGEYWSATMVNGDLAWDFTGSWWHYQGFKDESRSVRPVLGF